MINLTILFNNKINNLNLFLLKNFSFFFGVINLLLLYAFNIFCVIIFNSKSLQAGLLFLICLVFFLLVICLFVKLASILKYYVVLEANVLSPDKLALVIACVLMYVIYIKTHYPIQDLQIQFLDNNGELCSFILNKNLLNNLFIEWKVYNPNKINNFNFHAQLPINLIKALGIDPKNQEVIINELIPKLLFLSQIKHPNEFIFFPTKVTNVNVFNLNYIKDINNLDLFLNQLPLALSEKIFDSSIYNISNGQFLVLKKALTDIKLIKTSSLFLFILDDNLIGYTKFDNKFFLLQKYVSRDIDLLMGNKTELIKSLNDIIFISSLSGEVTRIIELKTFTGNLDFFEQKLTEFSKYNSEIHIFLDDVTFNTLKADTVRFEAIRAKFVNVYLYNKSSITLSSLKVYPKSFFTSANLQQGTPYQSSYIYLKSVNFLINRSLSLFKH